MKKKPRFPDYDLVTTPEREIITFGTNVWLRKDSKAIKIVFPCGDEMTFAPMDEIRKTS